MATRVERGRCLLQSLLDKKGWEQMDLVIRTGISNSQISLYISNKQGMSLNNAATIARALNVKIQELYEWHEYEV